MNPNSPDCSATLENGSFRIRLGAKSFVLVRSADLESLWEAMGEEDFDDERIPYWTELWPATLVLAQWISRMASRVAGRLCLDLGCGLGLSAIAGSDAGGRIVAVDYEFDALVHCLRNARINDAPSLLAIQADWRQTPFRENSFDIIWAGDILYERRAIHPVANLLRTCLKPDGVAWIADPGRDACREFLASIGASRFSVREALKREIASPYPSAAEITATVWELRKTAPNAEQ